MGAKEAETDPPKEDDWQNTSFTHHGRSFERVTVDAVVMQALTSWAAGHY
jgi:hypothetical protein